MDREALIRLATAIDCEGSAFIAHTGKRSTPKVVISQKNRMWLERFREMVGFGSIQRAGQHHDCFDLVWQSFQALEVACLTVDYT